MAKFKKVAAAKAPAKTTKASKPAAKKATTKSPVAALGGKAEMLSRSIMESAQGIWLAGMGAFNRAQEEGSRLFENLVKEGSSIEQKTRKLATGRVDAVRDAVENRVEQVRDRATDTWDKLEKIFEERVQRALNRLGVPGHEDLGHLAKRVDALTAELKKLGGEPKAPARKPATKAAKPAAKAVPKPAKPAAKATVKPVSKKPVKAVTAAKPVKAKMTAKPEPADAPASE